MKQKAFLFLLCGLLLLCLAAAAKETEPPVETGAPVKTEAPVEEAKPPDTLVVLPYDKTKNTVTVMTRAPEDEPLTLRYGAIGGQDWLLVLGDPLPSSERKLNLVGSTPLFAIHRDDAATLMTGQPLEAPMTLYAKRSRLPRGSEEADYRYVWVIGTRAARALEKEAVIPWSDSDSAVPLLVHIKNFDLKHDQDDKGKVTLGKGSQVVDDSLLAVSKENNLTLRDNGQYLVLLSAADGHSEFAVVNVGGWPEPSTGGGGRSDKTEDQDDADALPPEEEWAKRYVPPPPPDMSDGFGNF